METAYALPSCSLDFPLHWTEEKDEPNGPWASDWEGTPNNPQASGLSDEGSPAVTKKHGTRLANGTIRRKRYNGGFSSSEEELEEQWNEQDLIIVVKEDVDFKEELMSIAPPCLQNSDTSGSDSSFYETLNLKELNESKEDFERRREQFLKSNLKPCVLLQRIDCQAEVDVLISDDSALRTPKKRHLKLNHVNISPSKSYIKFPEGPTHSRGRPLSRGRPAKGPAKSPASSDLSDSSPVHRKSKHSTRLAGGTLIRKRYWEEEEEGEDEEEKQKGTKRPKTNGLQVYRSVEHVYTTADYTDDYTIERILSVRATRDKKVNPDHTEDANEYYVKFKYKSYIHCKWICLKTLQRDERWQLKLKNFHARANNDLLDDGALFHPDYVIVDRVLDVRYKDLNTKHAYEYLVKWCSLPYMSSTWEKSEDVEKAKVAEFKKLHNHPLVFKTIPRPPHMFWNKLEGPWTGRDGLTLKDYQLEGVNWLLFNWYNRNNCILADEMGLGKTIQAIALLTEMHAAGIHGPFLVIAPLSTLGNWAREFSSWTYLYTVVYHGSQENRHVIEEYELFLKNKINQRMCKFDVLLTTFEMVGVMSPALRNIQWRCVIIDEAHRLKNKACKLHTSLNMLTMEYKVLLSGTPLQNSLEELFSLLNFLEPKQFDSEYRFIQKYGNIETKEQVHKLQELLKPLMLRRLKEDVEKNLKPREETIIEVELTDVQKKYYRAILEKNWGFLKHGNSRNLPNLINIIMELRKCCNHPFLVKGAEEMITAQLSTVFDPHSPDFPLQTLVHSAGKLVLLDKLLPKLKAGGHKVLIFSQMVKVLGILEDYVTRKGYLYERLDGQVASDQRQAAIDRFSKPDSQQFLFLICTRAGGQGINLTAADTCIIYDSDWNPQNDLQAQARCHRIGQTKAVKTYRLVTRNSCEQLMLDKAGLKLGLDHAVLQSMSGDQAKRASGIKQFSKVEVETLLKKGAYAAVMEDTGEEQRFCGEDIDQILQSRATTRNIESLSQKGSTFSKASFVTSQSRSNIEIDDPEFWEKWAKKAKVDPETLTLKKMDSLVINQPRMRKQGKLFNNYLYDNTSDDDSYNDPTVTYRSPKVPKVGGSLKDPQKIQGPLADFKSHHYIQVEKALLRFGWGRWTEILRQLWDVGVCNMGLADVENVCRAVLSVCLLNFHGKAMIKEALWILITPFRDQEAYFKHRGLTCKSSQFDKEFDTSNVNWLKNYKPEAYLSKWFCNQLKGKRSLTMVQRVRYLLVLKQDVIGENAQTIMAGVNAKQVSIPMPHVTTSIGAECSVPEWWDKEADKCLLIGAFKHGCEEFMLMRADPCLCFLERMTPPPRTQKKIGSVKPKVKHVGNQAEIPVRKRILPAWMLVQSDELIKKATTKLAVLNGVEEKECVSDWPSFRALSLRLHQLIIGCRKMSSVKQTKIKTPISARLKRSTNIIPAEMSMENTESVWQETN
ncbi:hypothetical protein UPYG_G00236430 [Umbra pygmaea]|uniref:DNA helicase n=1 Tax=Umbra pygmaea TaxID=75934 RepID=A0ABD0X0K5_UMBPY